MGLGESLVGQIRGESREQFVDPYASRRVAAAPAPSQRRRRPNPRKKIVEIATSLWGKLIPGAEAAGEGIIPYARVPRTIRDQIPVDGPVVGWDVQKLSGPERALLQRMIAANEQAFK